MVKCQDIPVVDIKELSGENNHCLSKLFKCGDCCPFKTNKSDKFRKHCNEDHKSMNQFRCYLCYSRIKDGTKYSLDDLFNHFSSKHIACNYQCNNCLYRSYDPEFVKLHMKYNHKDKNNLVIKCKKQQDLNNMHRNYFKVKKDLITKINKTWKCNDCEFTNESRMLVKYHYVEKHGFMLCEEAYSNRTQRANSENIENSVRVNQVNKPCGSTFTQRKANNQDVPIISSKSIVNGDVDIVKNKEKAVFENNTQQTGNELKKNATSNNGTTLKTNDKKTTAIEQVKEKEVNKPGENGAKVYKFSANRSKNHINNLTSMTKLGEASDKSSGFEHYCLICKIGIRQGKMKIHLQLHHKTDSTFKCKKCDFFGDLTTMKDHCREKHSNQDAFYKFVIPYDSSLEVVKSKPMVPKRLFNDVDCKGQPATTSKTSNLVEGSLKRMKKSTGGSPKSNKNKSTENDNKRQTTILDYFESPKKSNDDKKDEKNEKQSTKIEVADDSEFPLMEKRKEKEKRLFFCFFCELKLPCYDEILLHMKDHVQFGYHCNSCDASNREKNIMEKHKKEVHDNNSLIIDDNIKRRSTLNWIIDFLNNQEDYAVLIHRDSDENDEDDIKLECPHCVKAVEISTKPYPVKSKTFDSLTDFKKHYMKHTCWYKWDCTICGRSIKSHQRTKHAVEIHKDDKFFIKIKDRKDIKVSLKITNEMEYTEKLYTQKKKRLHNIKDCSILLERILIDNDSRPIKREHEEEEEDVNDPPTKKQAVQIQQNEEPSEIERNERKTPKKKDACNQENGIELIIIDDDDDDDDKEQETTREIRSYAKSFENTSVPSTSNGYQGWQSQTNGSNIPDQVTRRVQFAGICRVRYFTTPKMVEAN